MFSIVCSVGELASISQQSHTTSSYSVYADDDDSPYETPSLHDEKRDMSDNTSSQPQRASLRPPPPPLSTNQQKIRNRSSHTIVPNRSLIRAQPFIEVGLDETDGVAPCLDPSPSRQYPTVNTSTLPACIIPNDNEAELRPPTLPFASRANNQSKNRPSSYGSNNTFGAVDENSSNPSSPVTDDGLSLISDIDYHQRTHSGSSISNHQPNGNVFYAASAGIPSHHTLGGSFQLNSLRKKSSSHRYTSSEEEDAEIRADKQQFGTTSSSCSSSSLRSSLHLSSSHCTDTLPEQHLDNTLFQRIDDYLLVAQKKNNDQI
ncbi:hypothetical protein [Parasitella parasitica]|uniref:Uncharacterized protein n=1 Tax=Parasitella parasitica TaxID=35722 RepID=A0A0B7N5M2_9FUNG|nr:hypothetical protein [Parasitella parasitica]